jgi:L-asparagine transporter-like permease
MSAAVITCLVTAIVLLFVTMVLAAMGASDAQKRNYTDAHKYSMWSSIVSGISTALLVAVLILYVYATPHTS